MPADVVVVGAGLSGLAAANRLDKAGLDVRVIERNSAVGGRLRTDVIDGYLIDHGFAVINPAYPALAEYDLSTLELQRCGSGVHVLHDNGRDLLTMPTREFDHFGELLRSRLYGMADAIKGARWMTGIGRKNESFAEAMTRLKWDTTLSRNLFQRFMAGVLADETGSSDNRLARELADYFVKGTPGVPSMGVGELAKLIASPVEALIQKNLTINKVMRVNGCWELQTVHGAIKTRRVILAVPSAAANELLDGALPVPRVVTKGLATWWFAAEQAPSDDTFLTMDGRSTPGPLVHAAVMTNIAPRYAPAGRHLMEATQVLGIGCRTELATEEQVRTHLGEFYGPTAATWQLVASHVVADALPHHPAPWRPVGDAIGVHDGLALAGDYLASGSIEGALSSGHHAADAILSSLGTTARR